MSLLQLPPETLIQIFDYIGSSYFRSDLSRLTVSKQWSEFARTACFQDFSITQKTLQRLMSSPYVESSLPLLKSSVETLALDLKGFEDWDSVPPTRREVRLHGGQSMTKYDFTHGLATLVAWTTELNNDLLHLATTIQQSRKLHNLHIQATSELAPEPPHLGIGARRDYLFLSPIRTFLSAGNLTSLELDLCSNRLLTHPSQEEHGEGSHICTSIAALLNTLRRLRLRMPTICAEVLKPRPHGASLRLNEVLVNLSLSSESPLTTWAGHARCCDSSSTGGTLQLKADMENQAQVLVAQMAAPKTVRILTHALPIMELRAFDVLRGRTVALSEGADWDGEGEAIEEPMSDEESEISDLSSDVGG